MSDLLVNSGVDKKRKSKKYAQLTSNGLNDKTLSGLVSAWRKSGAFLTLEEILLDMNEVSGGGLSSLLKVLEARAQVPGTERLLHLDISMNPLYQPNNNTAKQGGRSGLDALCDLLLSAVCPLHLSVRNAGLDGVAAQQLADALRTSTVVGPVMLDLSQNSLGDEGITHLAAALAHNTSLHTLILRDNFFGDPGCAALATALRQNKSLTELVVRCNQITDDGAACFASVLSQANRSLQLLDLSHAFGGFSSVETHIHVKGAQELAKMLASPTCALRVLKLNFQPLGLQGLQAIAAALAQNVRLRELQLDGCLEEEPEALRAFQTVLEQGNASLSFLNLDNLDDQSQCTQLAQLLSMNQEDFSNRPSSVEMGEALQSVLPLPVLRMAQQYLLHRPLLDKAVPAHRWTQADLVITNFVSDTLMHLIPLEQEKKNAKK